MIETISIYRTPDGKTFETQQRARDHLAFSMLHRALPRTVVEKIMRNHAVISRAFELLKGPPGGEQPGAQP